MHAQVNATMAAQGAEERDLTKPAVAVVVPKSSTAHKHSLSWMQMGQSLAAGGIAGAVSRSAVAPLERLKILMQIQGNDKVYTGVWQGLSHMWKTEGIRGLFRGNGLNCMRIVPNSAIKFLAFEQFTRSMSASSLNDGGDGKLTPASRLGAGAVAGILGMSATYPMDMIRGRISVQQANGGPQYRGLFHGGISIARAEGLRALFRGWVPSTIGVVPYMGLNFGVYETLKAHLVESSDVKDERELSVFTRLAAGAVAGTAGQTLAYPFDVVRRRLQVSGWDGARSLHAEGGHAIAYKGMVDCFVRTVREGGISALFKGLAPNYVKVVPSIAIAFVTYEQVKDVLGAEVRIGS